VIQLHFALLLVKNGFISFIEPSSLLELAKNGERYGTSSGTLYELFQLKFESFPPMTALHVTLFLYASMGDKPN
jgi:hypothetical protein